MIQTFKARGQFYFRVRALGNNKIVAQSEGYKTKRSRDRGIAALVAAVRVGKIQPESK